MKNDTGPQYQILVVDDDRDMRALLGQMVAELGCRPLEARSASMAVDLLERERVDMMLLDLYMPGATGMDLLKALRKRRLMLPTVVVSGYVSSIVAKQLVELGVQDIVAKPFAIDRLLRQIRRVLQMNTDRPHREQRCGCPVCSERVGPNDRFCCQCGHQLQGVPTEIAPTRDGGAEYPDSRLPGESGLPAHLPPLPQGAMATVSIPLQASMSN